MPRGIAKALGLVRYLWLVFGIALVIIAALEGGYRLQASLRRSVGARLRPETLSDYPYTTSLFPYADSGWYRGWGARRDAALREAWRYHPYRGWTIGPFSIPGMTVGTDGLRILPGGRIGTGRDTVYVLGGSAVWGYESRDSATIGAFIARGLQARGTEEVTLISLAQAGYNLTQEIATLTEMLRAGQRPVLVVFIDGVNEVGHFVEGEPLWGTYGQRLVERRIALGKRTALEELLGMGRHVEFVQRIEAAVRPSAPSAPPDPVAACDTVGRFYLTNIRQVEALATAFDFTPLFIWQPPRAMTGKPLTDYEEFRQAWEARGSAHIAPILARCSSVVDSLMAGRPDTRYLPFHSLFDRDTTTVFLDGFGHLTERANAVVGDTLARLVESMLSRSRHGAPAG